MSKSGSERRAHRRVAARFALSGTPDAGHVARMVASNLSMAGLQCTADAAPIVAAALDRGLLVNRTAATVVRLLPAYIVTETEIDEAVAILDGVFSEGARH